MTGVPWPVRRTYLEQLGKASRELNREAHRVQNGEPSGAELATALRAVVEARAAYAGPPADGMLTPDEHALVELLGSCWASWCAIVGDGPSRDADLREFVGPLHALQNQVLAQAAARAYPDRYRLAGGSVTGPEAP